MKSSKDITDFAMAWTFNNINAEPYDPGHRVISSHVEKLVADAAGADITEEELREQLGDLDDYIAETLEEATDNEVERLASKDD